MSCEIKTSKSGTVTVKTYPSLFRDILTYYDNNTEQALSMYGLTLSEEFKDFNDSNKPSLESLLAFVDSENTFDSKKLDKNDRQLFLDMTLNEDGFEDVQNKFVDSFTVNGTFGIDKTVLKNAMLFSDEDIIDLMNLENSDKLQKLYYKLKDGNEELNSVNTPFIIKTQDFGKVNPDEFLTNVYNNYIGLTTQQEIKDKANELQDELVIQNPDMALSMLQEIADKQSLVSYETDDNTFETVKKQTNNVYTRLQQTLDVSQDFLPVISQVQTLINFPIENFAYELPFVQRYVLNLEKQFAEMGVNIKGFSEMLPYKNYNQIQDFLVDIYNFLQDIQTNNLVSLNETLENYSDSYNTFFGITPQYKNTIVEEIDSEGIFLDLETNQNEESLFLNNSIIRYSGNVYQKITDDKTLEELYEMIYDNPTLLPSGTYSTAITQANRDLIYNDIDTYVSDKTAGIVNEYSDIGTLKKIVAYKILTGGEVESPVQELDNSYLQRDWINPNDFLIQFNKEVLKNERLENIFYFSNRGLESNFFGGEYTKTQLQNELSESMFDRLQQYALLSNNQSLEYLKPEYELTKTTDQNSLRNYYVNNKNALQELKNPHRVVGTAVVVENLTDDFIKVKGDIYERVTPSVYELVEVTDNRYLNYNLKKPTASIKNTQEEKPTLENGIKVKTTQKINNSEIEFC